MVDSEQISEAIMIAKHTIVKIKYREGNNTLSARLVTMMMILDMEKAMMPNERCNNECDTLKEIQQNLNRQTMHRNRCCASARYKY